MRAQQRIRACRLIEKASRNKEMVKELGIKNISRFDTSKVGVDKEKVNEK